MYLKQNTYGVFENEIWKVVSNVDSHLLKIIRNGQIRHCYRSQFRPITFTTYYLATKA